MVTAISAGTALQRALASARGAPISASESGLPDTASTIAGTPGPLSEQQLRFCDTEIGRLLVVPAWLGAAT